MKKLGFGLMRLPQTDENDPKSVIQEQANQLIDRFLEGGFTYFDTAYMYHQGISEEVARKALVERYDRCAFTLTDKLPIYMMTEKSQLEEIFAQQLERCGVNFFDYYLLHNLGDRNYETACRLGAFEFLQRLKDQGKVKAIGFSFHDDAALLNRILTEHPEMEYVQLQINYVDWENDSIQARACYETAVAHGKPVIVMEPVKGGALAKVTEEAQKLFQDAAPQRSIASWALRYCASLENVCMVLSGMSNMQQVEDNISFMANFEPLTDQEQEIVAKATKLISQSIAIGCTGCRYCMDGCPQGIPIADFFALYNNQHLFGHLPNHDNYYMNQTRRTGKASDCVDCGQCVTSCPQHLEIPKLLQTVAKEFETVTPV